MCASSKSFIQHPCDVHCSVKESDDIDRTRTISADHRSVPYVTVLPHRVVGVATPCCQWCHTMVLHIGGQALQIEKWKITRLPSTVSPSSYIRRNENMTTCLLPQHCSSLWAWFNSTECAGWFGAFLSHSAGVLELKPLCGCLQDVMHTDGAALLHLTSAEVCG